MTHQQPTYQPNKVAIGLFARISRPKFVMKYDWFDRPTDTD